MIAAKTPCIGICSTTSLGDSVCRGCKRYSFEVINWNSYDEQQKVAVLKRLEKLICQILENKFTILCEATLESELKRANVPFNVELSPYCWLHNLFKKNKNRIADLRAYGVTARVDPARVPLNELLAQIDSELQLLSEAHLDRYFKIPT